MWRAWCCILCVSVWMCMCCSCYYFFPRSDFHSLSPCPPFARWRRFSHFYFLFISFYFIFSAAVDAISLIWGKCMHICVAYTAHLYGFCCWLWCTLHMHTARHRVDAQKKIFDEFAKENLKFRQLSRQWQICTFYAKQKNSKKVFIENFLINLPRSTL